MSSSEIDHLLILSSMIGCNYLPPLELTLDEGFCSEALVFTFSVLSYISLWMDCFLEGRTSRDTLDSDTEISSELCIVHLMFAT